MWKRSENIVHRLFSRQVTSGRPNRNIHRAREFYENVIPSHTVYEVDCPDQWWRRFTNDGQYLICFSKTYQDVLIYRPLWPSYWTTLDSPHDLPSRFHKFESYFTLLHQIPLARTPNEVICKDFFLATENNLYGIFATSTAPDLTAAAAPGAVPGVPCIEKITFLVVRFADGAITGRTVFEDDYIHLAHNAGVFLHEDLLAVLSIRFQRIHILQIRDGGVFLDVRTVGDFCREDDELLLNSQSQAEMHFQEDQRLQRKARGRIREDESNPKPQPRGMMKPWTSLIDRKRPRHRDDDDNNNNNNNNTTTHDFAGGNNSHEIDILYDGYFRGLFTGGDNAPVVTDVRTGGHGEHENGSNNNNRRIGIHSNGNGSTHGRHSRVHGRRLGAASSAATATATAHENGSHEVLLSGHQYAAYENNSSGRRHGIPNVSSSGSLYSSSGSDIASHSYTSTADLGSSDATASHHEFSSHHRDEAGPSERWMTRPVPSMSVRGSGLGLGLDLGLGLGLRPNVEGGGEQTIVSTGASGGGRLGLHLGLQSGNPGNPNSGVSLGSLGGFGIARGGRGVTENATGVTTSGADAVLQSGSHILRGLKQRLLSFILQGIQNDDTNPACKAQRLKRFYYHFQHYVDLVMWKVQFLDRYHLLIKFGSVDGVVLRNSEASHQTAFLAIYNMETTEILGFHQNSSEELLQLVERYWDHFRVVPQNPLYMNFISSSANNSFAREQFRKEKDACISGKAGSYTQVIKRTLASLPHNSQSQSPSAYFDQYLFHYDEKLISSTDRHKPCVEHPIKFISRRRPNTLKFKINPGLELGSNDGHIKRVASFLFHPIFPFAISVQQSFMQTSVVNFHFRR